LDVVLGIDGGGTKTACAVSRLDGTLLGLGYAGASNPLRVAGGFAGAARAVAEAIEAAMADAGLAGECGPKAHVRAVFMALGGISNDDAARRMETAAREVIGAHNVYADNDAVAALAAAVGESYGVIIIAGTGSIALACDRMGRRARSGGWGYRIGDEGSGQWLGRLGLDAVARAHDGRGPATALTARALRHFGIVSPDDLRTVLYRQPIDAHDIAGFSPEVMAAAGEGDGPALAIVRSAACELVATAIAAARQLGLGSDGTVFPVAPAGGVFSAGEIILGPFREELAACAPAASLVLPEFPPVVGAVMLALERAGAEAVAKSVAGVPGAVGAIDGVVRANLRRSWAELVSRLRTTG
jgi:N-acetylglucosamine kinase-like BadF-type ATPase